ncbi:1-aminocyclopropane-1-carboxylate deaminase/D-cysteine desulfhydrase [Marinoscillum sp. 108]|uniref:1-aminocyclopropane-1-carboxylate deaminase/D-cysteine desulfhydrase n=1 Tax=Marinoscillum sp. 108 TaxID=2653151 RepID=UPI0012F1B5A1|nr:pyridoxal-phosphate dependent enzyme [Marinoscillum sp. 108]VXD17427.1 1-aminocyclopropane-1-carboxylate deaminase [Marinoscillum sp. 108]
MARIPSPIGQIHDPLFEEKGLEVWIKRDDLIHPHIMGNKWRKLKYNLLHVRESHLAGIVTFGGAYSNHIAATAAACAANQLPSIGIIRGDELSPDSNPTLRFASDQGMKLQFVSRNEYRQLKENQHQLQQIHPGYLILPEGGTNELAIRGCQEIWTEINQSFDYVITSVGTGGTMAGLLKAMSGEGKLIGISALKGNFIHSEFRNMLQHHNIPFENYELMDQWHFGGYGKVTDDLVAFINDTKEKINVLFDPIYTAKMYFAVTKLIETNYFPSNSKIVLIHTGGLQGIAGFIEKQKKNILL